LRAADGASLVKVFFRVLFAALAIGGWMVVSGRTGELRIERKKLLQVVAQGLVLTVNWGLFLTALDMTQVATAELLGYLGPVFVAALAPLITHERFDRRIVLPLALSLLGIVAILAPQGVAMASPRETIGAGLAFLSSLTYATLLLRSKKILRGVSSGALMLVEYGVACVALAPFVVAAYLRGGAPSSPRAYIALAILGVVQTAIAGFIFLGGLRRVRTDHAAVLTYVEPVSAVVFAAIFLGEPLRWTTAAGAAMVVIGGAIVARLEAREGLETVPIEATACEECPEERDGLG
jgi:drug/metabolite transporter (DMT)-like permease